MTITTPAPDLARHCRTMAAQRGWTLLDLPPGRSLPAGPREECSALVIGDDVTEPAILRVRAVAATAHDALDPLRIECAARGQARSEYLAAVLEEPTTRRARGQVVVAAVVEHAPGGSLRTLLDEGPPLPSGAAATILLGVAHAMGDLYSAGWSGAPLSLDTVAFRADGCPILARLDGVRPAVPGSEIADRDRFHAFARTICQAIDDGRGAGLFAAIEGALAHPGWGRVVAAVLNTIEPAVVPLPAPPPVTVAMGAPPRPSADRSVAVSERLVAFLDDRPVHRLASASWRWLRARPRLLVLASIPVAAVVVALMILPPSTAAEVDHDRVPPGWSVSGGGVRDELVSARGERPPECTRPRDCSLVSAAQAE